MEIFENNRLVVARTCPVFFIALGSRVIRSGILHIALRVCLGVRWLLGEVWEITLHVASHGSRADAGLHAGLAGLTFDDEVGCTEIAVGSLALDPAKDIQVAGARNGAKRRGGNSLCTATLLMMAERVPIRIGSWFGIVTRCSPTWVVVNRSWLPVCRSCV
jgi:hypothetical protein